jgi:hypothetical protein
MGILFRPGGLPEGVGMLDHQRIYIYVFRRARWIYILLSLQNGAC